MTKRHCGNKWLEQLARVRRWYTRVESIRPDAGSIQISEEDRDIVYAFFLNCCHLYDWMKASKALDVDVLKKFFREEDEDADPVDPIPDAMRMCHDICIAAKHLEIDHGLTRPDYELLVAREYNPDSSAGTSLTSLTVFTGPKYVELFGLADECMRKLEKFLSTHDFDL